jgi:hypothetical protein
MSSVPPPVRLEESPEAMGVAHVRTSRVDELGGTITRPPLAIARSPNPKKDGSGSAAFRPFSALLVAKGVARGSKCSRALVTV